MSQLARLCTSVAEPVSKVKEWLSSHSMEEHKFEIISNEVESCTNWLAQIDVSSEISQKSIDIENYERETKLGFNSYQLRCVA